MSTFSGNCFERQLQSCRPHFPWRIFGGLRPGLAPRASRLVNKTGKLRFSGLRTKVFPPDRSMSFHVAVPDTTAHENAWGAYAVGGSAVRGW